MTQSTQTVALPKGAKARHNQKVINNLHHKLFNAEVALQRGLTGLELQRMERYRFSIETRLMELYGTDKYGLCN